MSNTMRPLMMGLTALSAAAALSACGTTKLEDSEVADEVKSKALAPKGITGATVRCPKETEAKKDAKIRCSVTDAERNKGTVVATVLDEDGKLGRFGGDTADLQRAVIERNATTQARSQGATGDVNCGAATKPRKGGLYFCTANIKGSGTGVVLVSQKDERGNVSVRVRKRRITTARIEKQVGAAYRKQAGISVTVDCPSRVQSRVGAKFTCKVTNPANGRSQTIEATQKDTQGNFNLRIK